MSSFQSDSPGHNVHNPLNAMREGEVMVFSVKRHPIGLIAIYASFAILLVVVGIVAVIAPNMLPDYDPKTIEQGGMIAFAVSFVFSLIYVLIGQYIYNSNSWILTSDSLTQVNQRSLFDRQTSQLSLGNLEDVTVHQDGILAHMFNYGTLKAETAGEHSKFAFIYCPNPNEYAQKILVARETFEQGQWYGEERPNHQTAATPAAPVEPAPTPPPAQPGQ